MAEKEDKSKVNYKLGVVRRCGICSMFIVPDGCTAVKGDIDPSYVCNLFELDKKYGKEVKND